MNAEAAARALVRTGHVTVRRTLNRVSRACLACLFLLTSACANLTAVDEPLKEWSPEIAREMSEQVAGDRSSEMLVLVAFSGGGTRAASFAYGVLQELEGSTISTGAGTRSVLDEVDIISSVSGGSFTSAYFGLRGERIFGEFEERFLRKDVEGALLLQVVRPVNWFRLLSSTYGRADIAARYYSDHIFDGAAFSDLRRADGPFVIINSTDLATGNRFSFTPAGFDPICADLAQYPLSRGVAASSAVPVVFSPITLKSYAGSCGYEPPAWLGAALNDAGSTTRKLEARSLEEYLDRKKRPWLHLVDGGISDNLGLRAFYDAVTLIGNPRVAFGDLGHPGVRQILIISVNANVSPRPEWPLEQAAPTLAEVVGSVSSDEIARYSVDTLELVRSSYGRWTEQMSTPERPVTLDFVEVSFDAINDDTERTYLNNIGTNFHISDEQVDRLIAAARELLRESPQFQAFIERNRPDVTPKP
ncbi:MAG: patatin-like phospholipase family protein [Pseudomonadota bacterium]|nr:patatin-like phospholipase family protein [Pseudomonadota bacterium]